MTWNLSTAKIIAKSTEIKWPNWIQGLIQNFIVHIPRLVALAKTPNIGEIILSRKNQLQINKTALEAETAIFC